MTNQELKDLQLTAVRVREGALTSTRAAYEYAGGSLSAAELFTWLYFKELNIDPENPKWADRDRFFRLVGAA